MKFPGISIVTPCFNSERFLEKTIQSILSQNYPNLEYIIVDGGSRDGSIEIIKKYNRYLSYWISEPDDGIYDAINKGFARSTGEIMAWSPASDLYVSDAFLTVSNIFLQIPQIEWLTSIYKISCNDAGEEIAQYKVEGFDKRAFKRGQNCLGLPGSKYNIQQQSTFWRRSLWEKVGGRMETKYRSAGDFELWSRFYKYSELWAVNKPLGIFRNHKHQISVEHSQLYFREQQEIFKAFGGKKDCPITMWIKSNILINILYNKIKKYFGVQYKCSILDWDHVLSKWIVNEKSFL